MKKPYTQPEIELRKVVLSDTVSTSGNDNLFSDPFDDFWAEMNA